MRFSSIINKYIAICICLLWPFMYSTYPVLFVHGIGDACHFKGVQSHITFLKSKLETEVKCLEVGNGFISSWFMQFSRQAEELCRKIKSDTLFQNKFSIFAVSQGTLIARYIIQKCEMPGQVMNYVSLNGPQMGIGSLPKITCPVICPLINDIIGNIIYKDYFQKNLGPAGYYKNKYNYEEFLKYSSFLADLNNEKEIKSQEYKDKFTKLNKVLLIKNLGDTVITPKESSFFEFFDKQGESIVPLFNSTFYKEDWIGLRTLNENQKLFFLELQGEHVIVSDEDMEKYIIPFLK
jgi:palmitoyl-protein thioesterase